MILTCFLLATIHIVECGSFQPKSLFDVSIAAVAHNIIGDLELVNDNVLNVHSAETQNYLDELKVLPAHIIEKLSIAMLGYIQCEQFQLPISRKCCYVKNSHHYPKIIYDDNYSIPESCVSSDNRYVTYVDGSGVMGHVIDRHSGNRIFKYDKHCKATMINGRDCFFMNPAMVEKYNIDSSITNMLHKHAEGSYFMDNIVSLAGGIGFIERSFASWTDNCLIVIDNDGKKRSFSLNIDMEFFVSDKKNLIACATKNGLALYSIKQDLLKSFAVIESEKKIRYAAFSPCSKYVAYGTNDEGCNLYIVDIEKMQTIVVIKNFCEEAIFEIHQLSWAYDNASLIAKNAFGCTLFTIHLKYFELYEKLQALLTKDNS